MNLPMQSKSHRGGFLPPWQMTQSIWRSMAKSCAPEFFPLSRTNIEAAHTNSGLVWPLRMAFWMGYRCYKATASDSLQNRWTRWLWFSLTPSKTTVVHSKRLHTMPNRRLSLLINWGKESSARLAKFPLKPSQNCFQPPKIECVRNRSRKLGDSALACLHQKCQYLRLFWPNLENSFLAKSEIE